MEVEKKYSDNPEEQILYSRSFAMGKISGTLIAKVLLLEEALHYKSEEAHRDHTTQLLNGAAIEHKGAEWVRQRKPFIAVYFDLLNFKKINDLHGHLNGNQYLQDIGDIFVKVTKKQDLVARIGGDEFLFLLDIDASSEDPARIAHAVMDRTDRYITGYNAINYPDIDNLGISSGFAIYDPTMHPTLSSVISEADISMSLNKKEQHLKNGGAYRV